MNSPPTLLSQILSLWLFFSPKRRHQFYFVLILIVVASIAEIVSIGAIIPFINLIEDKDNFFEKRGSSIFAQLIPGSISSSEEFLTYISIAFCIAIVIAAILRLVLLRAIIYLSFTVGAEISSEIYRKTLYQPYQAQISRNTSEVISSVTSKSNAVIYGILLPLLNIISGLILMISILATLFYVDPLMMGIIFIGFSSVYFLVFINSKRRLRRDGQCITKESTNLIKILQEGLGGVRDILIDGTQEIFCLMYAKADKNLRQAQAAAVFIGQGPRYLVEMLGTLLLIIIAYVSVRYSTDQSVSSIVFLGVIALGAQKLLPILQQIYSSLTSIQSNGGFLKDVLELLGQNNLKNLQVSNSPLIFNKSIELVGVSFAYNNSQPLILNDVSISIKKGDRVGVIGKTGEGKSTLLDILLGLIEPSIGYISIDKVRLEPSNYRQWQSRIAHVPQFIFLADTTVAENIAFGVPTQLIDLDRVKNAAKLAQISKDIESWSSRYSTVVGERGVRLSGGQRQRIGLARALYKDSDVLILDEATSSLDRETENLVITAINDLPKKITLISIAHRLSTLNGCNLIIKIEGGKVVCKSI